MCFRVRPLPYGVRPGGAAVGARAGESGAPGDNEEMSPRRPCPVCAREIAVVGGRFARHDPPGRRTVLELVSCPGSRRIAPMMAPAERLFDPEEPPFPGQQPLF